MQINVAQLLKEPVGAQRNYKIDELAGENSENHVAGEVVLTRTNRGILATGRLAADIKGTCSRCLGEAAAKVEFYLEDEYFPLIDINSGAHIHPGPDDFTIDNAHTLDLNEAIRQYIIMSIPTKLLCKPDCPGICPVCGHELAKGDCGHMARPGDHRWDKLEQYKKESKV
jgi:uncharacterized protein